MSIIATGEVVDVILAAALALDASDVHFDPVGAEAVVRVRLHGRIVDVDQVAALPSRVPRVAVQRLKVLARLSPAEQRRPQDGHLRMETEHGPCDMRVSTWPTVRGERVVVRLMPALNPWDRIESIGLRPVQLAEVQHALSGGGVVAVCGRVGAGKSTTIRAMLQERSRRGHSVLTIEDPVERQVDGFLQMEVDERIGLTFAYGLRTALRQDPDALMVGEVRDRPSAEAAVRAGLLGHLVLTTVHASSPRQAMLRLLELGVEQELLAEVIRLIVWQDLQPVRCASCLGAGCEACRGVGLAGRQADFQIAGPREIGTWLAMSAGADGARLSPWKRLGHVEPAAQTYGGTQSVALVDEDGGSTLVAERSTTHGSLP